MSAARRVMAPRFVALSCALVALLGSPLSVTGQERTLASVPPGSTLRIWSIGASGASHFTARYAGLGTDRVFLASAGVPESVPLAIVSRLEVRGDPPSQTTRRLMGAALGGMAGASIALLEDTRQGIIFAGVRQPAPGFEVDRLLIGGAAGALVGYGVARLFPAKAPWVPVVVPAR